MALYTFISFSFRRITIMPFQPVIYTAKSVVLKLGDLPFRGHFGDVGDIFGYHSWEGRATSIVGTDQGCY